MGPYPCVAGGHNAAVFRVAAAACSARDGGGNHAVDRARRPGHVNVPTRRTEAVLQVHRSCHSVRWSRGGRWGAEATDTN
jgi:hypothetical protein